jgi:hypothetical protein
MKEPETGADQALVAYSFQLDERTEVRAYVQAYKGKQLAHIPRFKRWSVEGEYRPDKGIAVPIESLTELLVATAMLAVRSTVRRISSRARTFTCARR